MSKENIGTIDLTPTWESLMNYCLTILSDGGNGEQRKIIKEEMIRMARIADASKALIDVVQEFIETARIQYASGISGNAMHAFVHDMVAALENFPKK